jgi:hypothetical protein
MKRKIVLILIMLLIGYAAYVHGYFLDNGGKLVGYDVLELFPLWNIGAYLFWPAYYVISLIKPFTDLWQPWMIVGMWIVVHMIYAMGVSWVVVELALRIGYNSGRDKKN